MKRKVWELTVLDNPNRVVGGESDIFYTTDTEAFLIFRLTDADFNPATATLTLVNTSDKSVISETVPVVDKEIEWEMPEEAIAHSGNWQAQLVYTQEKDGKNERYTSEVVQFDVQSHLMTGRQPTLVAIENWNTFMETAQELLTQIEDEASGIFIDIDELEQQYRDSEQARVEAEDIRETNESARQAEESQRVSSESTRVDNEQQREANESLRKSSEADRVSAEQNRVTAENERNDLYDLVQQKLANGEFVGDKGDAGEIENLDSSHIVDALGYMPISETDVPDPTWANLQNKPTEFNPTSHTHGWSEITNKPSTFTPSTHTHSINDVTGLRAELDSVPELTKENVGLGNVNNVKQASKVEHDQLATDFSEHQADKANPHSMNKTHVGLSNVDNIKQMPISGGVLENYREKLTTLSGTSTAINLSLGNVFAHTLSGNTTYSITNAVNGQAHSFTLIITQTATVRTLTFPSSVKWQGGEIPHMSTANKTYVLTFVSVDGGSTWLGMSGGEF